MTFQVNEGKIDRFFRLFFGVAFLGIGFAYMVAPLSYAVMLVGIILVVTGATGHCGLYSVLGINTCGSAYCDVPEKKPRPGYGILRAKAPVMMKPVMQEKKAEPKKKAKKPAPKKKKAKKTKKKGKK